MGGNHAKAQRRKDEEANSHSSFAPLRLRVSLLCIAITLFAAFATAQEPAAGGDESEQYAVDKLVGGLDNPAGLAIRTGVATEGEPTSELFVAESGAGRVVRWRLDGSQTEALPAITGFPVSTYGTSPVFRIGPLGLEFMTPTKLAVGTGGLDDGKELVQVYALPEDSAPLEYANFDHAVGPVPAGPKAPSGEGNFISLAKTDDALFVASQGDDAYGWILKATIAANHASDLQPHIATVEATQTTAPSSLALNPQGKGYYLVAGLMGATNGGRDSYLAFFSPTSGKLALGLHLGLFDVLGLAYSPSGDLYACDFAWSEPEEGGVFRIDATTVDGVQGCRAVKIAAVTHPTALRFGPDGTLYVTALGDRTDAAKPATGVLLKITPKAGTPKL